MNTRHDDADPEGGELFDVDADPRWLLDRAGELAGWLRERHPDRWRSLAAALGLDVGEPAGWRAQAAGLADGLDSHSGLIEQHRGFHQLPEVDLARLEPRTTTMRAPCCRSRRAAPPQR